MASIKKGELAFQPPHSANRHDRNRGSLGPNRVRINITVQPRINLSFKARDGHMNSKLSVLLCAACVIAIDAAIAEEPKTNAQSVALRDAVNDLTARAKKD